MGTGHTLISFDLDGTLVDTAAEIAAAANAALVAHGMAPRTVADISLLIGGGARQLMQQLLAHSLHANPALATTALATMAPATTGQVDALMAAFEAHYAAHLGQQAAPYPGCHQALTALRAAGVRLACVTNKEHRLARGLLQATQLERYFELLIGGDSLPHKKPHASVLQHVAGALGASLGQMAHVGDSSVDVLAARQAGVAAWAVPYGYNAGLPITQSQPDRIFDHLLQVAGHVLGTPMQAAR
jgi:phosphoglycolate phosphatase